MDPLFFRLCGCLIALTFSACQAPVTANRDHPRDPWIMRSVLDMRPRMITLAMDSTAYLAYDASMGALYQVWRGGVQWEGAAFTQVKTVQPQSWGSPYARDSLNQPVWTLSDGEKYHPIYIFRGYKTDGQDITLQYELVSRHGDTLQITETPIWQVKGETAYLKRIFTTQNIPAQTEVQLRSLGEDLQLAPQGATSHTHTFDLLPRPAPPKTFNPGQLGSRGRYWLDKSGCNTCHEPDIHTIGPGYQQIAERYEKDPPTLTRLTQKVLEGGAGNWGEVAMPPHPHHQPGEVREMIAHILSLRPMDAEPIAAPVARGRMKEQPMGPPAPEERPGFGRALEGLHPSLDLIPIRPDHFHPRVGGMDFLPDGSLLISTWDSIGAVYRLTGVATGDTGQIHIERIAEGLAEPLGLKVVGQDIFVLQKQELTQLIDHDQDGITDEYRAICSSFGATADFHEFSYGLEYANGHFYATLGLAMRLMDHEGQHPDRGRTIKIARDGSYELLNFGLRQPNGIGWGPGRELFITDNQGKWLPANKLNHMQPGAFYGSRAVIKDSLPDLPMTPPAVWLPQDEIGNSPGEPILMRFGPYSGHMLVGEVTHGGIKRVFLEKVQGRFQGCVFRYTQGLEAGINRLAYGPDEALYVGGIGMNGNWGWKMRQYGLQKLVYNGKVPFEMLEIRALPGAMEITFTHPLAGGMGESPADYRVQQWWYLPTSQYGGPKMDLETLRISRVTLSPNRRAVTLTLPGLKPGHVVYFLLNENLQSAAGQPLWAGEAWYTLNALPDS